MEKHKQKILKCNKELGTLFSFHDSFLNIPPKRIYQKETYCLDLLFIVQTFLNEKKGYSIYGPHGYQLPITVNEMIVIAGKVFQYNNAVSRFQKLVETNKREAYTYAIDKGLTYFRENGQRVVGDYIELTQDRNQLLKFVFIDLLQKEPSLFLKIIIEKKLPPRVFQMCKMFYAINADSDRYTVEQMYDEIMQETGIILKQSDDERSRNNHFLRDLRKLRELFSEEVYMHTTFTYPINDDQKETIRQAKTALQTKRVLTDVVYIPDRDEALKSKKYPSSKGQYTKN